MKKSLFIIFLFLITGIAATAQIQYMPTYNRPTETSTEVPDIYSTPPSYQQPAQPPVQTIRTTAYVQKGENIYKVPIKVQIQGNNAKVTDRYVADSFGGKWERVYSGGTVEKCSSIAGSPLDSSFMYKAFVDLSYYYFDL